MSDNINLSLPVERATQVEINEWFDLKQKLKAMQEREMYLRRKIAAGHFINPREGTNNLPLTEGWVMKMQRIVDRKLDWGQFELFRDTFQGAGIKVDDMFKMKPELVIAEYRKLDEEKQHLFDNCLIIKDGAPQLDIVLPKRAVK